jgi:hypothetical protein
MRFVPTLALGAALVLAAIAPAAAQALPGPASTPPSGADPMTRSVGVPSPGTTAAPLPGPVVTPAPAAVGSSGAYDTVRFSRTFQFVPHAPFYSLTFAQPAILDPQVFVADPASLAGSGPEGIVHVAGVRNAYASDANARPIENAQGLDLRLQLGTWIGARGSALLAPVGNGVSVVASFNGLVPQGRYSLFVAHFGPTVTATPLDATGTTNSFTAGADGSATVRVQSPAPITRADAIAVVYHSDGADHGLVRGTMGVNAHTQLILRTP